MKTTMRRLRGFGLHRNTGVGREDRGWRDPSAGARADELSKAYKDMEDIRDCYENLHSTSAAAASSAYDEIAIAMPKIFHWISEFAESLGDMGACLLKRTALYDDEESGKVILMLGKLQYELHKIVDSYRAYIFQTITVPSESLLNELRTVEEMKRQCDNKRDAYEQMVIRYRETPSNRKNTKAALDDYEELATRFVFRLKSLKQGQPCSLLTQATRHHAAQLLFFKRAVKSLEDVDPHVKKIALEQHIEYNLSEADGVANDGNDAYDEYDDDRTSDSSEYYTRSKRYEEIKELRNSKQLEIGNVTTPPLATLSNPWIDDLRSSRKSFSTIGDIKNISQSAPLFKDIRIAAEGARQMRPSMSRKFSSYALPIPSSSVNSTSTNTRAANILLSDSSLERKKPMPGKSQFIPFVDASLPSTPQVNSDSKVPKRYSFSGPIATQPTHWSQSDHVHLLRKPALRTPIVQSPPKLSVAASTTFFSSPKITELHELPRPPARKPSEPLVGYSGPLVPTVMKQPTISSSVFPLPTPVQVVPRSFSTPSSGQRAKALSTFKVPQSKGTPSIHEDVSSPPLSPLHLQG